MKNESGGQPQISQVIPGAAIAGGEFQVSGKGFAQAERPRVKIGEIEAPVIIGSDSFIIAKVPEGASVGELIIQAGDHATVSYTCDVGIQIADNVHPVTNPAVDAAGNIFKLSAARAGRKPPFPYSSWI